MRRWIGLALLGLALTTTSWPAVGHAQQPDASAVLTAVALTEADVPAGLKRDDSRSGMRTTEDGGPSYQAMFVANGMGANGMGTAPIMGIVNIVSQYPDAANGMDRIAGQFQTNLGGNSTELAAPALGEASRAFTISSPLMGGAMTASTVFVAVRRAGVVASVAVTSMGNTPQTDVAVRLAQSMDQRLAAALRAPGS
jgi:hypothetical protein